MGTTNEPVRGEPRGAFSRRQVARGAAWSVPVVAVAVAAPAVAASPADLSCWDSTTVGRLDVRFVGPINTANNATFFTSIDGTCSGTTARTGTVVQAGGYDAARDVCEVVASTLNVQRLRDIGYATVPVDFYVCEQSLP